MKTTELKAGFQSGKYAELLKDIYIDESVLEYQKERYVKAVSYTHLDVYKRQMHISQQDNSKGDYFIFCKMTSPFSFLLVKERK